MCDVAVLITKIVCWKQLAIHILKMLCIVIFWGGGEGGTLL